MNPEVRVLAAASMLLAAACATLPGARPPAPDPDLVRAELIREGETTRTVRGLARVALEGPDGGGTASQVIVVALPDSARLETLTPMGTPALLATLRHGGLQVHAIFRHEYASGRATRETLGRLLGVPVPPELFLRLLAGLSPLPVRATDPRLAMDEEAGSIRVESVDGEYWQRLWTGQGETRIVRGQVGRGSETLFGFAFGDRRPADGRDFPFELRVSDAAGRSRLRLQYERLELNVPVAPDLFDLPPPADSTTRIIELGRVASGEGESRG